MIKVPIVPLSALVFYISILILWNLGIIPSPTDLLRSLETFYRHYGYVGLFLATLVEGIAYICLYVPGAFIIALTVFFSDRSFISFVVISLIVSGTLTLDAFINYFLGIYLASRKPFYKNYAAKKNTLGTKGFFVSMLHPNFLAFYFLGRGLEKRNPKEILYVPLFMFPYGLLVAYLLSTFSTPIRMGLESPTFMLNVLIIWFTISTLIKNKQLLSFRFFRK